MKYGRRKATIIGHLLAVIGSAICMFGGTVALSVGRVGVGLAAGCANVVFGKFITETMPDYYASKFAMAHNASICIGIFFAFLQGAILPDSKGDPQALKDDELWRVIYASPAIVGVISILLILFVFRQEPTAFCIMMGNEEEGKKHMLRVYRKADPNHPNTIEELLDL